MHCSLFLPSMYEVTLILCFLFLYRGNFLHDDEHVVNADPEHEEGQKAVHVGEEEPQQLAQAVGGTNPHTHRHNAYNIKI